MANNTIAIGWQDQPNGRGTFDILKTCGGTISLLCWSSVCPNVPGARGGRWSKLAVRFQLFLLAILGPDFIFMLALGQLSVAWKAKKAFHEKGHTSWTLRHCFFTNMGGIHLKFPERDSFPVDCDQLLYLVGENYMDLPKITETDIEERNKTDDVVRAIAIVQSLWFTINTLGRRAQGLHITTLELTTLAFVFLMTACSICWWRKPMDISHPMVVDINMDLSTTLQLAQAPTPLHGRTPLSFLNRHEWFMSQFWASYTQILRNVRLVPQKSKPAENNYFSSIDFPEIDLKWELIGGPLVMLYSSIFMTAWNFTFPTVIERTLWRAASTTCLVYGVLGSILAWSWHNASAIESWFLKAFKYRAKKQALPQTAERRLHTNRSSKSQPLSASLQRINGWFDWIRNLSPYNDPALAVPVRLWIPTTVLCAAYCFSRAYILVEDVVAMRSLPESAYQTINWGQYSPIL